MSKTASDVSFLGNAVIFKGDDDSNTNDPYVLELEKLALNSNIIPALKFEFSNVDELLERLSSPQSYSGMIFSSPRCVEAVKKCGNLEKWKGHKIFCVGSKTATLVHELGLEPIGEDCGNAASLADFILKDYSSLELPLLLPHGNLSLKTLTNVLTNGGMMVETIEVYTTVPNPNLNVFIKNYFEEKSKVDFVVYMSPSAVIASISLLEKFQDLSTIKFITLGPTTASCLRENGIVPCGVAEKPTPQHLAATISFLIPVKRS